MGKIIACVDGSVYVDPVCEIAAWAASRNQQDIALLHVVQPHTEMAAKSDLSGQIGLGAKTDLLERLSALDEEHGRLEQQRGQLMLDHASEELQSKGVKAPEILHRRGSLQETIIDLDPDTSLIVMGKRGEHSGNATHHLGSNFERVARATHKPVLAVTKTPKEIKRFLIVGDNSHNMDMATDYIARHPLLKGLDGHVLNVEEESIEAQGRLQKSVAALTDAGFSITSKLDQAMMSSRRVTVMTT